MSFSSLLGKKLQEGKEYHGCEEEYNVEKRDRGSNIILPVLLRLLGRISNGERGKGTEIMSKKIKI